MAEVITSQCRLDRILDVDAFGVIFFDSTGTIIDANDAFLHMTGYTRAEIEHRELTWRRLMPEEWVAVGEKQLQKLAETGRIGPYEKEYYLADGSRRWMLFAGRDLGDGTIAAHCIDISSRKEAERELLAAKKRLSADLAGMTRLLAHLGTWRWDLAINAVTWSPALYRIFGVDPDTFIPSNRAAYEMLHPDDRARHAEFAALALAGKPVAPFESRIIRPNGEERVVLASGFEVQSDQSGNPAVLFGAVLDVTERKRAEEALQESEKRYRRLFETMQESFAIGEIIHDAEGNPIDWRYLDVNPAAERTFGRTRDTMVGRTYRELFPDAPWQYWVPALGEVAMTGNSARLEHETSDNHHFEAIAYSPKRGHFAAIFSDVTERKRAQAALQRAQKMESISLLAGGVAHDFNNLLTVIMGSASSALDQCPSCEHSKAIVSAAERAATLTKQLLAYAGKGQFRKQLVDLNALVSQSKHLLAASVPKRVSLTFNLQEGLPPVEEDPSRVEQILLNLVINAGEAIAPKTDGSIEVTAGVAEITPEVARQQTRYDVAPGAYVWLEVGDTGTGMDSGTVERIFDPFFSTKFTGRGLGLAAVDGIVRSSNGFIDVHSSPGLGTAFRVFLPASGKKESASPVAPVQRLSARGASAILVVDDEEMVRKLACVILRRHGYEVLEATDGKHALEVLAEAPSLPSAVLLDLAMPVMGGDELIPILSEKYPGLKILVTSGYPEEEARADFAGASVAGFLQKPYTAATLTNRMDEVLEGESQSDFVR